MIYSYIFMCLLWCCWCFLHSFLANEPIKQLIGRRFGMAEQRYRLIYNIFSLVTVAGLLLYQTGMPSSLIFHPGVLQRLISWIFITGGLAIMMVCILKYFRQLSGLKNTRPLLIITGLHRFVRHPLYGGTFVFAAGLVLLFPLISNLLVFIIIVSYTLCGIVMEEKKLVDVFGKAYILYQQNVPMIIPIFPKHFKRFRLWKQRHAINK